MTKVMEVGNAILKEAADNKKQAETFIEEMKGVEKGVQMFYNKLVEQDLAGELKDGGSEESGSGEEEAPVEEAES